MRGASARAVRWPEARNRESGTLVKRFLVFILVVAALPAAAQGMNDLIAGKLVDPKVGQWAWYDLTDKGMTAKFSVRQAIVGEEKVSGKKGYWVELEIVPEIGYRTIYKMLLTGSANDPKNIHKIMMRQEPEDVETVSPQEALEGVKPVAEPQRELIGEETIATANGPVPTQHYRVEGESGGLEVWINEKIPPTGIVRMKSPSGEMLLRAYGEGGESAASAIDVKSSESKPKVTVKTGKKPASDPSSTQSKQTQEKRKKP